MWRATSAPSTNFGGNNPRSRPSGRRGLCRFGRWLGYA